MYVKDFKNKARQEVHCINSWDDNEPEPWVAFKLIEKFYRVSCTAVRIETKG